MLALQSRQGPGSGDIQEKASLITNLLFCEEQNQLPGGSYPGWRAIWGTGFVFSIKNIPDSTSPKQ